MYNTCGFRIITDDAVQNGSEALRSFVKKHFVRVSVLGTECWAAIEAGGSSDTHGVAPRYPKDVNDEIRQLDADKKNTFRFWRGWDDGTVGHFSED